MHSNKQRHILHINDTLAAGGTSVFLYNLIAESQKEYPTVKHTVAYIKPGPYVAKLKSLSVQTIQLKNNYLARYAFSLYSEISALITIHKIDIMHAMLLHAITYARLVSYSKKVPVVCGIHGDMRHAGRFHKLTNYLTSWCASKYVCVSTTTQQQFVAQSFFKQKTVHQNTLVINNGITPPATHPTLTRTQLCLPENAFIIGSVGRLAPEKSYDVLLHAFAKLDHKKTYLCLVGDGPERTSLEQLAHLLGINNRVVFTGHRDDARAIYPLLDCFVLSSQTEGLSISLLEAMSAGCAVVSTHIAKKHDAIIDGDNGLLVPINEPDALAQALTQVITNKKMRTHMQQRNPVIVKKHFSIQAMVQKYITLFLSLCR